MKVIFNIDGKKVRPQSLRYKSKAVQIEVMRDWFFENYEDPANACPYESRQGGYHYIYGGPYDASEELQAMFESYVKLDYIQELVDDLQGECFEWSGNSDNIDWYDSDLYDAVISSEKPFHKFLENIDKIKSLSKVEHPNKQKEHLLGILYTNIITALETLYVELFINSIEKNESYITDYIEKSKNDFKVSKEIATLLFRGESIEIIKERLIKTIKEHLISTNWHNTDQVVKRYKTTFGIDAQNNWPIGEIDDATLTRNHLVHRGGKDKDGNPVMITEQDLEKLLDHAIALGTKLFEALDSILHEKAHQDESEF
ncbi:TPA: hypothetical protein ACVPL5_001294 [Yersinia enterocolitica]